MSITVIVNTLNEEKNLPHALTSVSKWADEIVVVDMESDDETTRIASKFGAKIFNFKRSGYVEPARNYAISKATKNWIFILDADEIVPSKLALKLKKIVKSPKGDYYRIPRKNIIFGMWIKNSRWWPDYNIRFFRTGTVSWNEIIHSVPLTTGIGVDMKAKESTAIIHNHYESIEQFITRLNKYTSEHAKVFIKKGYKFEWSDLIRKPGQEFLSRYFFGKGYKDGIHGLALAGLQAFSEFVVYLKIWQNKKFESDNFTIKDVVGEMNKLGSEIKYWEADSLFKETGNFVYKIKRKLRI